MGKKETKKAVRDEWKEDIRELTQTGKTKPSGAKPGYVGHPNRNLKPSKSSNPEFDKDCPIRSKGNMTEWFKEALQDNDIRSLLRSSLDPERQIEKNTKKINDLETEVSRLTLELDEFEQYGRRNAIRIFNPIGPSTLMKTLMKWCSNWSIRNSTYVISQYGWSVAVIELVKREMMEPRDPCWSN